MTKITKNFTIGGRNCTIETGRVARQTLGSVLFTMDKTVVLSTVACGEEMTQSFLPLSVFYQEKYYAAGRIPGSFFRRERGATEKETLTSRLIDRPLRPLFPKKFNREIQLICTVLSADDNLDPDIPALLSASAALSISGLPFEGPVGAVRVGYDGSSYTLNPDRADLGTSQLDMVIAGTKEAVLMVESEAKELNEDLMLGAVFHAHEEMQSAITAIEEVAAECAPQPIQWTVPDTDIHLHEQCTAQYTPHISEAYRIVNKQERVDQLRQIHEEAVKECADEDQVNQIKDALGQLEYDLVRQRLLTGEKRIDGRDTKTVRPINVEVRPLPQPHGSALFTRGETQALGVVTLGSARDAQMLDNLDGEQQDHFMLHYNFPPFSVGEVRRLAAPGRREIGHGKLVRRALTAVLPSLEEFPYTVRVVSEILESNGSSSMASVCAGSLSLMDAGVPLNAPVAGVAMGLIKEGDHYVVLTDILGDEDHLGDMDFKVAGTEKGVTALQMDIKIKGINREIMQQALTDAHNARLHILGEMAKVLSASRPDVAENAPRIHTITVHTDKIRDIIGKGGSTIRAITEESGANIDIEDSGKVHIYATNQESMQKAIDQIKGITASPEIGNIYEGTVVKLTDFGAFVNFLPGRDGLVHISHIANERVEKITDYIHEGERVKVKVVDIDERGRVRLSMKEVAAN